MTSMAVKQPRSTLRLVEDQIAQIFGQATKDYADGFEDQRRHFGRAFQGLSRVTHQSKLVFRALGHGDVQKAEEEFMYAEEAYAELLEILDKHVPGIFAKEIENDAGQELAEARIGIELYPVLIGEKEASELRLPTDAQLRVTPQAWLAGAVDASSELGKLAKRIAYYQIRAGALRMTREELYERRVAIAEGIQKWLDSFALAYPPVLSATRRRGQGFGNKRRLAEMCIVFGIEDVLTLNSGNDDPSEEPEQPE